MPDNTQRDAHVFNIMNMFNQHRACYFPPVSRPPRDHSRVRPPRLSLELRHYYWRLFDRRPFSMDTDIFTVKSHIRPLRTSFHQYRGLKKKGGGGAHLYICHFTFWGLSSISHHLSIIYSNCDFFNYLLLYCIYVYYVVNKQYILVFSHSVKLICSLLFMYVNFRCVCTRCSAAKNPRIFQCFGRLTSKKFIVSTVFILQHICVFVYYEWYSLRILGHIIMF